MFEVVWTFLASVVWDDCKCLPKLFSFSSHAAPSSRPSASHSHTHCAAMRTHCATCNKNPFGCAASQLSRSPSRRGVVCGWMETVEIDREWFSLAVSSACVTGWLTHTTQHNGTEVRVAWAHELSHSSASSFPTLTWIEVQFHIIKRLTSPARLLK